MGKPIGLAKEQLSALGRLSTLRALRGFYLAGGTAIAAHLGHRRSLDLDLFSRRRNVDLELARRSVQESLPRVKVVSITDATIHLRAGGVLLDLVRYPYALLEPPVAGPGGMPVAGLLDLATMKLAAIARRGLRRDFWDLYAIHDAGISLSDAMTAYHERFGTAEADAYHVLRSLTYFDDAEAEAVFPAGLTEARWRRIKDFFVEEAPRQLAESKGARRGRKPPRR